MKGYKGDIEKETLDNAHFRHVIYTGKYLQLVLMSLKAGEEIGEEIHADHDQFFRFESGTGKCIIDENQYAVKDGDAILIPAGARHNVINTGSDVFKMYTLYGPPNHQDRTLRETKEAADRHDEHFDGRTSE